MANTFLLKIVTPSKEVYNGNVSKIFLKNSDGQFEIMASHEPMITSTVPFVSTFIDENNEEQRLFISTSIVHVTKKEVTICSDAAEFAQDIDFERARKAKKKAEERLTSPNIYDNEMEKLSYIRAVERLKLEDK